MGITIYDLAREAGVGIGTVSRCLNNHPSVSPGTRAKVLDVARRLNYQPHVYARGLASKKTNIISIIIPYFTNYFFTEVLHGVQDKAADLGVDLMLYGVNDPAQAEFYLRRSLHRGHVDGVLFFSMNFPETSVVKFREMNLPIVLVDTHHPQFDSIRVKNMEGAMLATRHLVGLGHSNIAMINASLETQPAKERLDGYRSALEEAGLQFLMSNVKISTIGKQDGFNKDAGRASMRDLVRTNTRKRPITATFIASDVQAIGALEAARELGVRVPEDLAIIGFDDIELAQHAGLTTMRQPMYEMGTLALDKIFERIANNDAPPTLTTFMPELIVRQTCGARLKSAPPVHEEHTQIQLEETSA